jgi:flavin-dependent dehydrogenase
VNSSRLAFPRTNNFTRPWRRLAGCNVYLIGDAAAQVKVTTVGGLVTGLRGARAAADANLHRTHYLQELRPLRRELSLHLFIRSVLNGFCSADYDRLLGLLNEKTIQLLGRYNRDQAAGMLYRILLAQPRFLGFAPFIARGFWKNKTEVGFQRQSETHDIAQRASRPEMT